MGNIFSKINDTLDSFILNRRNEIYNIDRSKSPESVLLEICSDFYCACQNNQIDQVKRYLNTLSQDEIDRIEPNDSTTLHAACYDGHTEVVRLLLGRGADRSILNKFQCLSFDEASNNEIKQLFFYRIPDSNRLISNTGNIEWEIFYDDVLEKAIEERQIIENIYKTNSL